eukprot:5441355-Prymnesium_polylepis.1
MCIRDRYISLISTLTGRTPHTKQERTTSLPGGPGEASSAVGVALAGSPAQRATSAGFPRHHCDRRAVRLRWRVGR